MISRLMMLMETLPFPQYHTKRTNTLVGANDICRVLKPWYSCIPVAFTELHVVKWTRILRLCVLCWIRWILAGNGATTAV